MSGKEVCAKCKGEEYDSKIERTCKSCGSKEPRILLCLCSSCGKEEIGKEKKITTSSIEIKIYNKNASYSYYNLDLCDECLAKFKSINNLKGV